MLLRRTFLANLLLIAAGCRSSGSATETKSESESDAIGPLLAPSALAARLEDVKSGKTVVLYIGPDALFAKGHVPGARNVGALDSEEGRKALAKAFADIPVATEVVLYCGCCPVRSCPNVRPASAAVRALGRPNAHVLDLPTRFATDWTEKGYAVDRG